jgi:hypothetical protein
MGLSDTPGAVIILALNRGTQFLVWRVLQSRRGQENGSVSARTARHSGATESGRAAVWGSAVQRTEASTTQHRQGNAEYAKRDTKT